LATVCGVILDFSVAAAADDDELLDVVAEASLC